MFKTPNMGLTTWDQSSDDFSHEQLEENFRAIDNHNHSKGRGAQLSGESLFDEAIEGKQIAKEAIEGKNIEKGAIGAEQIDPGFLPLGSTIAWYRKPGTNTEPGANWVICDGTKNWSEVPNSLGYTTGKVPNLIGRTIRYGPLGNIGNEGGSDTANLAHSHTVSTHTHEIGTHTHPVGAHTHFIQGHTHGLVAHAHSIPSDLGVLGFQFTAVGAPPYYSLFQTTLKYTPGGSSTQLLRFANVSVQENTELPMQTAGHNHGGGTGAAGGGSTEANGGFASAENVPFTSGQNGTFPSGAAAPTTNVELGNISIVSSYVEMLPIMRVQ